jgi:acetyl-CoA acetyltransferase family protein
MTEAVIVDAVRTPIGRYCGKLSSIRPDDLGARVIRELLRRTGVDGAAADEIVFGCANQSGEHSRNVARMSGLLAGLPVEVPAVTVNRLCASGLEAVAAAARRVLVGEADVCIAGGVESMSRAPWVLQNPAKQLPPGGATLEDSAIGWRCVNPRMAALYGVDAMGETAENLADKYDITRAEQDQFALLSHQEALSAQDAGRSPTRPYRSRWVRR